MRNNQLKIPMEKYLSYMAMPELDKPEITRQIMTFDITILFDFICKYFNVDKKIVLLKSRKRELVEVRQIFFYFSNKYLKNTTLERISKFLNKDHSTVIHSIKVVNNMCETDLIFNHKIKQIDKLILEYYKK